MRIPVPGDTELLVPLHEGVFEQPMWKTFLERLRSASGARSAALIFRPPGSRDAVQLTSSLFRFPPELHRLFTERYGADPLQQRYMRVGRVYTLDELVELGGPVQRQFRDEIMAPLGLTHMRSMRLREEIGLDAWIVLTADSPLGTDVANLLVALTPHLNAALRVLATLERERTRSSMNASAFSRMNFGWIALDARCRIMELDEQADRSLARSAFLQRGPYDRLTPTSPAVDRELSAIVRDYASNSRARPQAINLSQDPWIDILVTPLRLNTLTAAKEAVAVIYFRGDRRSTADRCEQLTDVFDLTASEARLAWAMAQGRSIAEAAEAQGLTIETARNYSKKIYAKTGARGQVDLVRNILTGVLALA